MKKSVFSVLVLAILIALPVVLADSVEDEIQKLTHYAEDYETGNIDYVQLLLYLGSTREKLNEILGATGKHEGGLLKQEQIEQVFGEPDEETKWVWVEKEQREKKLDSAVPIWKRVVFDGVVALQG